MYDKILVPIAFDEDHDDSKALPVARLLANPGAQIVLFHVMDEIPPYAMSYLAEDFRSESRDAIIAELKKRTEGTENAQVVVVDGHSGRTIVDWAGDHEVDCIVISSHRPGLQDYFLGSTAARVVRHAPCAVHVLR